MKILWLSHFVPYPPKAGLLLRSYNMIKELSSSNQIDVIAFNQYNLMRTYYKDVSQGIKDSITELSHYCNVLDIVNIESDGSKFKKIALALKSILTKNPYTINWLHSEAYKQAILQAVSKNQYDIVHFDTISLHPYKEIIKSSYTILDHHNVESDLLIRRSSIENNILKKFYYWQEGVRLHRYEKSACPQYDLNITCSKLDSERLLEFIGNCDVTDIPNGVDVEYFSPEKGADQSRKSLIFAGTLDWYPNMFAVEYLVTRIWPKIKNQYDNITLYIVGSNPSDKFLDYASKDKSIKVTGFVDDVRPYIDSATVYVCPIKDGGGTKLKILDALAMGKAIVADSIAVEGIDVTSDKDILLADTVDEYVTAINELLTNTQKRTTLERNARQLIVEKYSYTILGERLRKIYLKAKKL